jgi:hypothetical protein
MIPILLGLCTKHKQKKKDFKNKLVHELEQFSDSNPQQYWKLLNDLKHEGEPTSNTGNPFHLDDWVSYFNNILNRDALATQTRQQEIINLINRLENSPTFNNLDFQITYDEIKNAINRLKNNKSPGIDGIMGEMIKTGHSVFIQMLHKLFNTIFRSKTYPQAWRVGLLTPIPKKGSPQDMDNYRGIAVNNTLSKVYGMILEKRLTTHLDELQTINKCQIGFRKKARTSDHLFVLHSLTQKYITHGKLYFCFVDFRKAYDWVWRDALLLKILNNNIRGLFYWQIKAMYDKVELAVKKGQFHSNSFTSNLGVKQGDVLSPILFNLFLNDLPDIFDQSCDITTLHDEQVPCLLYADDLVIISKTKEGLQKSLDKLSNYCAKWQLEVNTCKSQVMIMTKSGKIPKENFTCCGITLQNVKEYNYLGTTISNTGSFKPAMSTLKNKGMKALYKLKKLINQTHIKKSLALKMFDQLIKPILLYNCEIWGNLDITPRRPGVSSKSPEETYSSIPQESINISFCKSILGVSRRGSNLASMGELGRYPLSVAIISQLIKYAHRLANDPSLKNTLLEKAYKDQKQATGRLRSQSWVVRIEAILKHYNLSSILNQHKLTKTVSNNITKTLQNHYKNFWKLQILNSPKLDSYRTFKQDFYYEPYLDYISKQEHQIALTRLRVSQHDLEIERGRYSKPKTDRENRICKLCDLREVEDEKHFMLSCLSFQLERRDHKINDMGDLDNILHKYNKTTIISTAAFIHSCFERRKTILNTI